MNEKLVERFEREGELLKEVSHADNNIVQMDDDDAVNADYGKFTINGLEGRSHSEVLTDLSGTATANFDWNGKILTTVASITGTTTNLKITPAAGFTIVLDNTISIDAGVVTGATSITSTAFAGDITGDLTGDVLTAAQPNITSLGTLTSLTVSGSITANSGYVIEGYATGRSVDRSFELRIQPGSTPNTDINVVYDAGSDTYHSPSISNATDLAASGTSGSFSLSADGKDLTMDITEVIVGISGYGVSVSDVNSSDGLTYTWRPIETGGNLIMRIHAPSVAAKQSWLALMDAGDTFRIWCNFKTSS